jgi:hypothetical protein
MAKDLICKTELSFIIRLKEQGNVSFWNLKFPVWFPGKPGGQVVGRGLCFFIF